MDKQPMKICTHVSKCIQMIKRIAKQDETNNNNQTTILTSQQQQQQQHEASSPQHIYS